MFEKSQTDASLREYVVLRSILLGDIRGPDFQSKGTIENRVRVCLGD